jgi:hypothetical protein
VARSEATSDGVPLKSKGVALLGRCTGAQRAGQVRGLLKVGRYWGGLWFWRRVGWGEVLRERSEGAYIGGVDFIR